MSVPEKTREKCVIILLSPIVVLPSLEVKHHRSALLSTSCRTVEFVDLIQALADQIKENTLDMHGPVSSLESKPTTFPISLHKEILPMSQSLFSFTSYATERHHLSIFPPLSTFFQGRWKGKREEERRMFFRFASGISRLLLLLCRSTWLRLFLTYRWGRSCLFDLWRSEY